jgi:hypothetical protein
MVCCGVWVAEDQLHATTHGLLSHTRTQDVRGTSGQIHSESLTNDSAEMSIYPLEYLCPKWDTHSRHIDLVDDRCRVFSIILVGNQIADLVRLRAGSSRMASPVQIVQFRVRACVLALAVVASGR